MEEKLRENLTEVISALKSEGKKLTSIANSMGYTTTAQLHKALTGQGLLSTKAVLCLIENLNVNPSYLFLKKGNIFLSEEDEIEEIKKENQELLNKLHASEELNLDFGKRVLTLEKRNADLIDLTASAVEYHKSQSKQDPELGLKMIQFMRDNGYADFDENEAAEILLKLTEFLDHK